MSRHGITLALLLPALLAAGCFSGGALPPAIGTSSTRAILARHARPAAESPAPIRELSLSLAECLRRAFTENRNLTVAAARLGPERARAEVAASRAAFDPTLSAGLDFVKRRRQRSAVSSALEQGTSNIRDAESLTGSLGLTQRLPTGTEYSLTASGSGSDYSYASGETDARLGLTVTQPLLAGAGIRENRLSIRIAEEGLTISSAEFAAAVAEVVLAVEQTYWDRRFAEERLRLAQESLRRAEEIRAENARLVEVGRLPRVDLVDGEALVAARREEIVRAEKTLRVLELELLRLVNPADDPAIWHARLTLTDPLPQLPLPAQPAPDVEKAVHQALDSRPEIASAEAEGHRDKHEFDRARRALLPQLDLVASVALSGRSPIFGESIENAASGSYYDYRVGLQFSMPLGNRLAKARRRQAELSRARSAISLAAAEQTVRFEVRSAVLEIEEALGRISATATARRLEEQRLAKEREKFAAGKSAFSSVRAAQNDLDAAVARELDARAAHVQARSRYLWSVGTIAESHGIRVEPYAARRRAAKAAPPSAARERAAKAAPPPASSPSAERRVSPAASSPSAE